MSVYTLMTRNHLRIWFSRKPDVFLNPENQLRLVRFKTNPNTHLTLLYSSSLLNQEAISDLLKFCHKNKIFPLDFDTEVLSECIDEFDYKMYHLAKKEIDACREDRGGNLAAASDIARLIAPVISKGIYSDFDTMIDVSKLPEYVEIHAPILFDIGSFFYDGSKEAPLINNDIIAVSTNEGSIAPDALTLLRSFQENIITVYEDDIGLTLQKLSELDSQDILVSFYKLGYFNLWLQHCTDRNIINFRLYLDQSTRNIFSSLRLSQKMDRVTIFTDIDTDLFLKLEHALLNLSNQDFPDEFTLDEKKLIKMAWLEHVRAPLLYVSPIFYAYLLTIRDPDKIYDLFQSRADGLRPLLLKSSVMLFSGPNQILKCIMNLTPSDMYKKMSFSGNSFFKEFHSGQSVPLGTSEMDILLKFNANCHTLCDMSWLSQGQKNISEREQQQDDAARKIQVFIRNHR